EADAEYGRPQRNQPLHELVLLAEPRMLLLLIGVHRAAENEHRVEVLERARQLARGRPPLNELVTAFANRVAEHPFAHVPAVHDRQDLHQVARTFSACNSFRNAIAFVAACATRPPRPSGLVALLLKKA